MFSTYLYDAAHGTSPIVNGINLADEGGLVWFKNRTSGYSNVLFDTERGIANNLVSNTTAGNATSIGLASFNTNGFSFSGVNLNVNSESHVAWTFRKAEKFFDVVTYTGNGTSNRQIPHNLGSTPGFILIKRTDSTNNWLAWHKDVNPGYGIFDLTSTFTAGANGSRVDFITFTSSQATPAASAARVQRVFLTDTSGLNPTLIQEIVMSAVTASNTAIGATSTITFTNGLVINTGQIIKVSQSIYGSAADGTAVLVRGGNY